MSARTRALAFSGILTGFTVACLYLESIVPTGRAGFLVLASFWLTAVYLAHGGRWMAGVYVASLLLAFWLVPDKPGLLPFAVLFGPYPFLKNMVERLRRLWLEWVLKIAGFGVLLWLGYSVFFPLVPETLRTGMLPWVAAAVLVVGFVVYDVILTQWVHFYLARIAPHVGRRRDGKPVARGGPKPPA